MHDALDHSDDALLARSRGGDPEAFRRLVHRYEPVVAATVVGMLGPGPDTDDVGQVVFIRFYRHLDQFRGDSSLSTYLTRIAMNESLTALKRRRRGLSRFLPLSGDEPVLAAGADEPTDRADAAREIHRALGRLAAPFRAVVVLRHLQGLSTRETAAALAIPEGTVVSRLARAHRKLRTLLASLADDAR